MHEANFTDHIVDTILKELARYPGKRPTEVRVAVGEMLHLIPESVRMHYDLRARGTSLEGVRLLLSSVPVEVRCRTCGQTGGVEDHHMLMCGHCRSLEVELLQGNEVILESIQMEE